MKRKWLYSEAGLSEATGLSRIQLKRYRVKGEYRYGKGKGGPVELSQRAVDVVLQKFGIPDANLDGARLRLGRNAQRTLHQEQSTLSVPGHEVTTIGTRGDIVIRPLPDLKLLEVSQLVPNPRILRAKNGTGEIYQVIVPSSLVWAIGDKLRVKQSARHQGYFELVGKAPRWRGDRLYRHEFV